MTIPNYITLTRILLVPAIYTALAYYSPEKDNLRWLAASLFLLASFTDALDGFIVRRWKMRSELGTFLDPLADKLLLISAFLGVIFSQLSLKPPLWIVILIVFRDLFIVGGLVIVFITTQKIRVEPNILGKITTFAQMSTILAFLIQLEIALPLSYITACLTLVSGIVYAQREIGHLRHARTSNPIQ